MLKEIEVARKKAPPGDPASSEAATEATPTAATTSQESTMNDTTPAATEAETTSTKRVAIPPELVVMTDGRTVEFTGRTRLDKTILIDGDSVAVRFDFRNGQTATYPIPPQHMLYAAGHGWSQKLGDHVAGMKDEKTKEPATEEDMFLAIESLVKDMESGWNKVRTGEGTVSGAGIVLRALAMHFSKPVAAVKEIIEGRLAADKARGGTLTRKALYASFRNPDTELGQLIIKLESEKKKPAVQIDLDDVMGALAA